MNVILAPMEGVVDSLMRDMLTQIGGIDRCVTEFVRVVDQKLPRKTFYRLCPELHHGGRTRAGVPVRVQLLGQHPEWLAENALTAIELGSPGVDLNFGCPAKTVNKSKGGAVLLKEPDTLYKIVHAVRSAVDSKQVVSAKVRLGYDTPELAVEIAQAIESAGADELVIHARTKRDGYRPPAYWEQIAKVKEKTSIPIIANGEIWSAEDAVRCQQQSQCVDLMIGRGALALPNLANTIVLNESPMPWSEVANLLIHYSGYELAGEKASYFPNRIKQWCGYLKIQYPEALALFSHIRTLRDSESIVQVLRQHVSHYEKRLA